jgi:hypothetical protein
MINGKILVFLLKIQNGRFCKRKRANEYLTHTAIIWVLAKPVTHGIIRIMKLSLLGKSWRRVIKNEGTFN